MNPPVLSHKMQFVRVGEDSEQVTPLGVPSDDRFPVIVQFFRVASDRTNLKPPPPRFAQQQFPEIVQLISVGEDSQEDTAPVPPEFPEIVQFRNVGEEFSEQSTPPAKKLALERVGGKGNPAALFPAPKSFPVHLSASHPELPQAGEQHGLIGLTVVLVAHRRQHHPVRNLCAFRMLKGQAG